MSAPTPPERPPRRLYRREGRGLEFERVAFFSDAIFAIAMTLLVVAVGVPALTDGSSTDELARALDKKLPEFFAFFIGFFVLGQYWIAHHRTFGWLKEVDATLVGINLVYLAFVAFLPFPAGLFGEYIENPLSIVAFAGNAAVVSFMEWGFFRHAWRDQHFERQLPVDVYRWGATMSLIPVGLFLLSMPVAFANTWLAIVVWFLNLPVQVLYNRRKPAEADAYYE